MVGGPRSDPGLAAKLPFLWQSQKKYGAKLHSKHAIINAY